MRGIDRWMPTIIKLLAISEMLQRSLSFRPCYGMTDSSSRPRGNMPIGHVLSGSHPRFNDCSGSLNLSLWRPSTFILTAVKLHKILIMPECNFQLYWLEFIYWEIRMYFLK
jgi:hypothetical protein